MMICKDCGMEVADGSRFCNGCGSSDLVTIKKNNSDAQLPVNNVSTIKTPDVNNYTVDEDEEDYEDEEYEDDGNYAPEKNSYVQQAAPVQTPTPVTPYVPVTMPTPEPEPKPEPAPMITPKPKPAPILSTHNPVSTKQDNTFPKTNANEVPEGLSTYKSVNQEQKNTSLNKSLDDNNPIDDPYYDDVLPSIDNEIYQIPKDIILKAVGAAMCLFICIVWLIYMLP